MVDESRRDFLKIAVAGIAGLAAGGVAGYIIGGSSSKNRILELESEIERLRAKERRSSKKSSKSVTGHCT